MLSSDSKTSDTSTLVRVKFVYRASSDMEMDLQKDDIIMVRKFDASGWWEGESTSTKVSGFFPSNHVELFNAPQNQLVAVPMSPGAEQAGEDLRISNMVASKERYDASDALMKTKMGGMKESKLPGEQGQVVKPKTEEQTVTRYGMWATNMTIGCGMGFVTCGTVVFYWLYDNAVIYDVRHLALGIYAIVIGLSMCIYEMRWRVRKPSNFPARAFTYTMAAVPALFSIATLLPAACLVLAASAHAVSAFKSETFAQDPVKAKKRKDEEKYGIPILKKLFSAQEENKVGKFIFVSLYVALNLYLFFRQLFTWFGIINAQPPELSTTHFVAYAKAWGIILDLNCAVILLPVCRTFIRYLYDLSTGNQLTRKLLLRKILAFIPLDRALHFHKAVAWLVLWASFFHTIAHLVNYGLSPAETWDIYGFWPWFTGVGLFICMLFMYGAVPANVKHHHFEIFWYSHHFFIAFFALLIPHGRGGFNTVVWKWLIGPVAIYIVERIYRARSAYQNVELLSVTNMKKVLAVEFSKKSAFPNGYKEGQYLYLNCPHLSQQWHPFTISSAPQEDSVTLHIRVVDQKHSWTARLAEYLSFMMPNGASYSSFRNADGQGKVKGPDGKNLFRVYGPHSAPTQHISEYSVDMIIGAGIGVTPLCATLKSIVHHRWKFSIGKSFPDHAYFYFVCSHRDLDSFRWFIRILKEADDEVHNLHAQNMVEMALKTFVFYIWITSVPENSKPEPLPNITDDVAFWGYPSYRDENLDTARAPWTERQMFELLKCPPKQPTRLGNIRIYRGRPEWDKKFAKVAHKHKNSEIGVAYCGNPAIARDIKQMCISHSNVNTQTFFRLHKENF